MHVLITGGGGFLGQILVEALLENPETTITITDLVEPINLPGASHPRVAYIRANLAKEGVDISKFTVPSKKSLPDVIYVLHGVMSAQAEQDFELGMAANLDATRALLESIRRHHIEHDAIRPRLVYTSSLAIFGPPEGQIVSEDTTPAPRSSYGAEKAICELLVAEYTRRQWIDGIVLRLPTISVRPGVPAKAASAFLSGIIREPLNGQTAVLPVRDLHLMVWLSSPGTVCQNLVLASTMKFPSAGQGSAGTKLQHRPIINLPGITTSINEMLLALSEVGGTKARGLVQQQHDPEVAKIVESWPSHFDVALALSLGFKKDKDFEQIVRDYKERYLERRSII